MIRKLFFALILILAIVVSLVYWHRSKKNIKPRNVLLITIDTLRADHLGCYGYPQAETPNIDRWAEKGALFLNATATTPLTLPSHSSIMTGAYPLAHGVRDNGGFYLEDSWTTLAESARSQGIATGGFISAFVLDRRWGIAQGFDEYYDHFELSKYKLTSLDSVQRKGEETMQHALSWLQSKKDARFFAWIHLYDPHTPYDPPEPFRSEFRNKKFGMYDGEIAYVDNLIGRLNDFLISQDLMDTTLVILTADHGESLGDHQESGHGFFIYDATTHIPLIMLMPGQKVRKVQEQVRVIDFFPTICDALGISKPASVQGTSLLPLVQGKALREKLVAYSESYYPKYHYGWSELKSLRTTEYKYIDAPEREFYRVSQDIKEQQNLYPESTERIKPFEKEMSSLLQSHASIVSAPRAIDDDSLEKLQALGYIGSYTAPLQGISEGPLPDPKRKIHLYNLIKLAQGNSAEGKIQEAFDNIQRVVKEDPRILEAHLILGNLHMKEHNLSSAKNSFQNALALNPDYASAIFGLASAYEDEEQWEAATAGFERLTRIDTRDPKPYFHLGDIAVAQKKYDQAIRHYEKVISLEPTQAGSYNRLGACYIEMKRFEDATVQFQKALQINERIPNAHFNLALIQEEKGQLEKATEEYLKELALYPETYTARFNLSRIYRHQKRLKDEQTELELCIREKSDFGIAYLYLAKNKMDSGEDPLKAKELVEEGLQKTSDKQQLAFGHYLLADIYNRLGQPQKAMSQIQQARKFQSE